MKTFLREPLVHFLALGALLFAFFAWRGGGAAPNRIVVTPGLIAHLTSGFSRTWQRPPTDAELKGLIDDWIKEEIATREAVATGLDRDDTIIRRRLRQKLEFLVEDEAAPAPPTDADLEAWLDAHPEAFRGEPRVAFRQVFVSPSRRGVSARSDAATLLVRLRSQGPGAAADRFGDPTLLPGEQPLAPLGEVTRVFGADFAREVMKLEPGAWSGPIASPFGLHLVFVKERVAAAPPALAEIRPLVEREVAAEGRRKRLDALYERLLSKYTVTIETPGPAPAAGAGASR